MNFTQWFKSNYELYGDELDEKPALLMALLMFFLLYYGFFCNYTQRGLYALFMHTNDRVGEEAFPV